MSTLCCRRCRVCTQCCAKCSFCITWVLSKHLNRHGCIALQCCTHACKRRQLTRPLVGLGQPAVCVGLQDCSTVAAAGTIVCPPKDTLVCLVRIEVRILFEHGGCSVHCARMSVTEHSAASVTLSPEHPNRGSLIRISANCAFHKRNTNWSDASGSKLPQGLKA